MFRDHISLSTARHDHALLLAPLILDPVEKTAQPVPDLLRKDNGRAKQLTAAVTVLLLSPLCVKVGSAQQVQVAANARAAASGDTYAGLEEIVVTAQRREESSQHAAIAISTLGGDSVSDANITRPGGLGAVVPSLQVQDGTGPYSLFYVRGVGNFAANGLSDAALAFNFDGVTVSRSGTSGFFYDLERVEVLKGPQGTLYGRNATGGAINVISKKPVLGQFGAEAALQYGNYAAFRADGMLNLPVGDNVALRAAVFSTQHDGYMNDRSDDQDDLGGRVSLLYSPSDSLRVSVVADYFKQGGILSGGTVIGVTNPAVATPPKFSPSDRIGLFAPETTAYLATQLNLVSRRTFAPFTNISNEDNVFWGVSATIDWTTPIGTLTVIPAYRDSSIDYTSFAVGTMLRENSHDKQTSVEVRLASPTDQTLRYVLGAFYLHDPNEVPRFDVNQQSIATFQSYKAKTDSQAAFANLTYALIDEVRLAGGVRYTKDNKYFSDANSATNSIICTAPGFTPCPNAGVLPYTQMTPVPPQFFNPNGTITTLSTITNNNSQGYSRTTWRAGADWDVTDSNLLYASYETGFKSGGFFFSGDPDNFYDPETIDAYTLGSKNRFLDDRLQINVELYHWKYHDQQISHLSLDSLGTLIFPTENVGMATFQGAELDLQARPFRHTLISADVQYNDAVYDDFIYKTPNLNGGFFNGTTCPNVGTPGAVYTVNCSGKTPPYAPEWSVSAAVQQTIPLPGGGRLVGDARVHYQTETLTGLEFLPVEYQDAYSIWDFDLTYSTANDRLSIGAFVNNAFNETVISYSFPTPQSGFATGILQRPQTYGARIGVRF